MRSAILGVLLLLACEGGKPNAQAIAAGLQSQDAGTRKRAAVSLGELGTEAESAIGALNKAVLDPEPEVRIAVTQALAQLGAKGRKGLAVALNDGDPEVRVAAARGLLVLGPDAAQSAPSLIAVLDDPENEVATAARSALVAIGPDAIPGLLRELVTGSDAAREHCSVALIALGEPALEGLIAALDASAPAGRKAALGSIASILDSTDASVPNALMPALEALFQDPQPEIAEAARRLHARAGA